MLPASQKNLNINENPETFNNQNTKKNGKYAFLDEPAWKLSFMFFFTFAALHSIEASLLKILKDMYKQNVNSAFSFNYFVIEKFLSSYLMGYLLMKTQNHRLILCCLYISFIVGLLLTTGTGSISTILEFITNKLASQDWNITPCYYSKYRCYSREWCWIRRANNCKNILSRKGSIPLNGL